MFRKNKRQAPEVSSNKVESVGFVSVGPSWAMAAALSVIKETGYLIVTDTPGSDEYARELLKNESIKEALRIEEEKRKTSDLSIETV